MTRCWWWRRTVHARLRQIDREVLFPILRQQATERVVSGNEFTAGTIAEFHAVVVLQQAAIDVHKSLPGQEHWRCACAAEEQ